MTISSIPQLFQFNTSQTNKNTREILPFQKKKQHFRLNNSKKKNNTAWGTGPGVPRYFLLDDYSQFTDNAAYTLNFIVRCRSVAR